MDTEQFRAALTTLGLSVGELARLFEHLGDDAKAPTIRRRIERWASGSTRIPGEATAFLNVLLDEPRVVRRYRKELTNDRS
jgi:hypothetical protein